MAIRWDKFLDAYAERLLEALDGVDAFMDGDSNPISKALKADSPLIQSTPGFSRMAVCRAAVLCQMQVFDRQGGPEGDHRPKALRRH